MAGQLHDLLLHEGFMNIEDFTNAVGSRGNHLSYAVRRSVFGHVCEFGVQNGGTLHVLADYFRPRVVHGFDSFIGLPEEWRKNAFNVTPKGAMAVQSLPIVRENARLVAGWFQDTLPKWLATNNGPMGFVHIDCDLYSSASCVLTLLKSRLIAGTVIVFDELYNWGFPQNYTEWASHEWRAMQELIASGIRLRPLARTTGYSAASVVVE